MPANMNPLRAGIKDNFVISWARYGGKTGVWRLMELCQRYQIRSTVVISALAAERYPEAAKELARQGHELAGHSWAQNIYSCYLDREQERENIARATSTLERISGQRPKGWLSPRATASDNTLELLAEQGYLWHGDYADDDLPYTVAVKGRKMVAIPYLSEYNDIDLYLRNGNDPMNYLRFFKNAFDFLYREGETSPKMLNASFHCHIFGRPFGAAIAEKSDAIRQRFPQYLGSDTC